MCIGLFYFILFCALWTPRESLAESPGGKAKIQGASYVNLRSGPDPTRRPEAVLKEGEEVVIEGEEQQWYLVSLADGRQGYVHKSFVQIMEKEPAEPVRELEMFSEPASALVEQAVAASPVEPARKENPTGDSIPLIKMIEGKEREIALWFVVAVCIFVVGWICGGNYYLRRDRVKRTKIRF